MTKKEVKKEIPEIKTPSKEKEEIGEKVGSFKLGTEDKILSYLKRNEKLSKEMLKSLQFIRKYYFWRSLFNGFKIALVIIVVILGIVTWDNIVEFFSVYSSGDLERGFSDTVKKGLENKLNF